MLEEFLETKGKKLNESIKQYWSLPERFYEKTEYIESLPLFFLTVETDKATAETFRTLYGEKDNTVCIDGNLVDGTIYPLFFQFCTW